MFVLIACQVVDFQPYYSFNPRRMEDLRLGAAILQEALSREAEKDRRANVSKVSEKAVAEAVAQKVFVIPCIEAYLLLTLSCVGQIELH
jgi:hypothetical protein